MFCLLLVQKHTRVMMSWALQVTKLPGTTALCYNILNLLRMFTEYFLGLCCYVIHETCMSSILEFIV